MPRTCEWCSESFTATTDGQVCCGAKCNGRRNLLSRKYGLTIQEWRDLLALQGHACAICRTSLGEDRHTHTDHDHETGKVRGLLCRNCNTALGKLGDQPQALHEAIDYLYSSRDVLGELLAA
jgi:hypothetical protein